MLKSRHEDRKTIDNPDWRTGGESLMPTNGPAADKQIKDVQQQMQTSKQLSTSEHLIKAELPIANYRHPLTPSGTSV